VATASSVTPAVAPVLAVAAAVTTADEMIVTTRLLYAAAFA
jgi:hypothetical protein